jgi:DNA-binding transcriptional regulator YiaG
MGIVEEVTMSRHDANICQLADKGENSRFRVLRKFDATPLVGLRTIVCDAAIEDMEEDTVEVPNLDQLMAAAAVARCLIKIRLRGHEVKAMRRIMNCTLSEFAEKLDEKTAVETVSRWESETQPMGGYVEKLIRFIVCESLHEDAPGIEYDASKIAQLKVIDPWKSDLDFVVPEICFQRVRVKESSGELIDAWDNAKAA